MFFWYFRNTNLSFCTEPRLTLSPIGSPLPTSSLPETEHKTSSPSSIKQPSPATEESSQPVHSNMTGANPSALQKEKNKPGFALLSGSPPSHISLSPLETDEREKSSHRDDREDVGLDESDLLDIDHLDSNFISEASPAAPLSSRFELNSPETLPPSITSQGVARKGLTLLV